MFNNDNLSLFIKIWSMQRVDMNQGQMMMVIAHCRMSNIHGLQPLHGWIPLATTGSSGPRVGRALPWKTEWVSILSSVPLAHIAARPFYLTGGAALWQLTVAAWHGLVEDGPFLCKHFKIYFDLIILVIFKINISSRQLSSTINILPKVFSVVYLTL